MKRRVLNASLGAGNVIKGTYTAVISQQDDARLKRYAFQIAIQLPESKEEALRVLEYARDLIDWQNEAVKAPLFEVIG